MLNKELKIKFGVQKSNIREIIAAKSGRTFNGTCLNEGITPFYDFYTYIFTKYQLRVIRTVLG